MQNHTFSCENNAYRPLWNTTMNRKKLTAREEHKKYRPLWTNQAFHLYAFVNIKFNIIFLFSGGFLFSATAISGRQQSLIFNHFIQND